VDRRDLAGKVAVVTGSGSPRGIGRATEVLLAGRGMRVVLADVNEQALLATVSDLRSTGVDVAGVATDFSDFASVLHLADEVYVRFGKAPVVFRMPASAAAAPCSTTSSTAGTGSSASTRWACCTASRPSSRGCWPRASPPTSSPPAPGRGPNGVMYSGASYATTKQAVCTLMEGLYGQLRDLGADIRTTVVLPPLARTNLAGDPATMHPVEQGLRAAGVPAVLVEPEELAALVLDASGTAASVPTRPTSRTPASSPAG
jgi:NAD(P)-dependent dehydrogenase (short-subunit alcohol dehydrogenase family)